ncbi:hypothetical protein E2C01_036937 [Portunus trituberculatus]|uniref:Uncharacterized protein n=1 Tax=Portunus trituberculatus TaxID=210409 RepID=A0A5B7FDT7_PORTR|nr:hypothetical protein [Portunus trituberculatus]
MNDDSVIRVMMEVEQLNPLLFVTLHNTGLGFGTNYLVMSFVDTWIEEEGYPKAEVPLVFCLCQLGRPEEVLC